MLGRQNSILRTTNILKLVGLFVVVALASLCLRLSTRLNFIAARYSLTAIIISSGIIACRIVCPFLYLISQNNPAA
jgi:hypothetical protein